MEYQLDFATRQIKRAFARAIGKSVPKILTELITNADDSYRRLHGHSDSGDPVPIDILFDRTKRRFSVLDQAEGLTDDDMKNRFVTYGQESFDRARGYRTRSLFGKGLRDVLFTQFHGQVKSIKDGAFYVSRFRWREVDGHERPVVEIKPPSRVTDELREALGIKKNGTYVEFQLAEGVSNPQPQKLAEDISRFYMLRMINSSPHRQVMLRVLTRSGETQERQINYRFPQLDVKERFQEDLVTDTGTPIRLDGEIGLTDDELAQGEAGYVEREGGILVLDEDDAVLDLTLFGFDEDPAARRISGTLRLVGAGAYIRQKLNQKEPEEVLTETRDGFDRQHALFRVLRERMQQHLDPIVAKLRQLGPTPSGELSEKTTKRHRQALDLLNRLANEMLGKVGRVPVIPSSRRVPPADGIAFVGEHMSVQVGVSTPAPLLINTSMLRQGEQITISTDNTLVQGMPSTIVVEESHGETVQLRMVRVLAGSAGLVAHLTATWQGVRCSMEVATTDRKVITPVDGLEFERDEYAVKLKSQRTLRLFVDLDKIPLGTAVHVVSSQPHLSLSAPSIVLTAEHKVTDRIAAVQLSARGLGLAKNVMVSSSARQYVAGTRVSVVKRSEEERGREGLFKEYKFQPLERRLQTLYVSDGTILINTRDPLNRQIFGDEPYQAVERDEASQARLAALILEECLWIMVQQALQTGKLDRKFPDNPEIDVRRYVDEKKFEIAPQIYALFVERVKG